MDANQHSRDDRERLLAETRDAEDWAFHIELLEEKHADLEEQLEAQTEIVAAAREVYEGWLTGDFDWDRLAAALNLASEPCDECDGKGHNTSWPHTTCPICGGSGAASSPATSRRIEVEITGDGSGVALPPIVEGLSPPRTWNPSGGAGASSAASSDAAGAEESSPASKPYDFMDVSAWEEPDPASGPKPTDSPFPQPALESSEKGLRRDREIPGKPADYVPASEPRLPPCLPHGVADCPTCIADAERIVDSFQESSPK